MQFFKPQSLTSAERQFQMLIDGAMVEGESPQTNERTAPSFGQLVTRYRSATSEQCDAAVEAAHRAFQEGTWSRTPSRQRAELLFEIAKVIDANAEELALLDCLEAGKPLSQARNEIADSSELFRYAASLLRTLHGETYSGLREDIFASTMRDPVGVVAMILPWNFPFLIACQKIPFALAAGCTIVAKPSEITSASLLRFGELVKDMLPRGVLNIVVGDGPSVGERLTKAPQIDMVSFTGSTRAGRLVAAAAAHGIKKVALELGGKNPQIVCADADLEAAAAAVVHGAYFNAGQCCQASGRVLVEQSILGEFTDRVTALTAQVRVGDPFNDSVQMGAIINDLQLNKIAGFVETAGKGGARVVIGGSTIESGSGLFFAPTVISDVNPAAALAQEEVFGPVLAVTAFENFDQAINLANQTRYGLGSGLWTRDSDRILEGTKKIRAGTVWVNCFMEVFPEMPFGGFNESGLGRECGKLAVEDYTETKSVVISKSKKKIWS